MPLRPHDTNLELPGSDFAFFPARCEEPAELEAAASRGNRGSRAARAPPWAPSERQRSPPATVQPSRQPLLLHPWELQGPRTTSPGTPGAAVGSLPRVLARLELRRCTSTPPLAPRSLWAARFFFFSTFACVSEKDYGAVSPQDLYTTAVSSRGKKKRLRFPYISLMWILISGSIRTESVTSRYPPWTYRALNHKRLKSKHGENNPFFPSHSFLFSPSPELCKVLCVMPLRRTFLFLLCLQLSDLYLLTSVRTKLKIS